MTYYYPAWQREHFPGFGLDLSKHVCVCVCVCVCMRVFASACTCKLSVCMCVSVSQQFGEMLDAHHCFPGQHPENPTPHSVKMTKE